MLRPRDSEDEAREDGEKLTDKGSSSVCEDSASEERWSPVGARAERGAHGRLAWEGQEGRTSLLRAGPGLWGPTRTGHGKAPWGPAGSSGRSCPSMEGARALQVRALAAVAPVTRCGLAVAKGAQGQRAREDVGFLRQVQGGRRRHLQDGPWGWWERMKVV